MTEVRIAVQADAEVVGRTLAAGFGDDPVLCWVFEEPGRADKLEVMFAFMAREALVPLGATYLTDGSSAAWTPPGSPPWPDDRGIRFITELAGVAGQGDLERLGVLDDTMQAHHPEAPHWYLGLIGTEPARRGNGLGTALMSTALASVDADHLPAYLESTNPRNISLYERHGFEVTGSIELPGGPSLTPMWRDAR